MQSSKHSLIGSKSPGSARDEATQQDSTQTLVPALTPAVLEGEKKNLTKNPGAFKIGQHTDITALMQSQL